jgi:hypothetical protein
MDRQSTSSPVFDDNDGENNYITKTPRFGLQRQMQGAQHALRERIENLAIDLRKTLDDKLSSHMEEFTSRKRALCETH